MFVSQYTVMSVLFKTFAVLEKMLQAIKEDNTQ
jgi:hypothetical protein